MAKLAALPPPPTETALVDLAFAQLQPLTHQLAPHYATLRTIPNRRTLTRHPLYPQLQAELTKLENTVERGEPKTPSASANSGFLRVVAWNIQRGTQLPLLLEHLQNNATLKTADVLLLSEVDSGMARSGNHPVARELAAALGMHFAFGISYLVLGDDFLDNPEQRENTNALAGAAILSRWPLGIVENVDLPELRDKFSSKKEKRLGKKRALLAEIKLPEGSLWCSTCHLDSNASPQQRAVQLTALLQRASALAPTRFLLGGDLNTSTYDLSGKLPLVRDLLHKFFIKGFDATVAGYLTPQQSYEQPVFATLAQFQLQTNGFNRLELGTYTYDVQSPFAIAKLHTQVGKAMTRWLQRRLRRWNGRVPARLDWFAGRGLTPLAATVVPVHEATDTAPASDHAAIVVDIQR